MISSQSPHDEIIGRQPANPPPIIIDSEEEWEVDEILDSWFKIDNSNIS